MKIQSSNTIRQTTASKAKRAASAKDGVFQSLMDSHLSPVDESSGQQHDGHAASHREPTVPDDVMLMLLRQGIDVLDSGLAQLERDGASHSDTVVNMGRVREQVQGLRQQYGANALLDESETILAVEEERLRQLA
ncbi:MAG: hypothetical protein R8J84_00275 [Mariprofundales bacterium]